jgi:flagellar hook-associated protein 1 FlgK
LPDLFLGLEISLRGLQAAQQLMDTSAHNVANSATPGYAREEVVLSPVGTMQPGVAGQPGGGVRVDLVQRVKSFFLDLQYWTQNARAGDYQTRDRALSDVQALLGEPGSAGLSNLLSQFWSDWQTVANNPESAAARQALIGAAQALVDRFHTLSGEINQQIQNLDSEARAQVDQVNSLAQRIATLNAQIQQLLVSGQPPNDLLDQRDQLIDQLSQYVPVQVVPEALAQGSAASSSGATKPAVPPTSPQDGVVDVVVGGAFLVQGSTSQSIDVGASGQLTWSQSGQAVDLGGTGSLNALLDLRDRVLPGYLSRLDQIAGTLVSSVNGLHASSAARPTYDLTGAAGTDFFDPNGTTAGTVSLAFTDPSRVAAALNLNAPGDGSNALAIADLQSQPLAGNATLNDAYAALVAQIGSDAQAASQGAQNQQQMIQAIDQQRQQVAGVASDEEMVNMVRAEHAYTAAAQTVTLINRMLDALVAMVGP